MSTKTINGVLLDMMLRNGLAYLNGKVEEINKLNVFPVADGDTGTNMYLTLSGGLKNAQKHKEVGAYLNSVSEGMLFGARGNSGVILSQFFNGFAMELSRCSVIGPGELRKGLIKGYRIAYRAVVHPVEGTILTVMREGIEHIRNQIVRTTTMETFLAMYIAEMKKTLSYTPEVLSVLKDAGVVDSGAYGFIIIFEGMLKYLYGDVIEPDVALPQQEMPAKEIDFSLFNEHSVFNDGYCMEFILQRLSGLKYEQYFKLNAFIDTLKKCGESLVVVEDNKRVKVHIHTMNPAPIIAICQKYGEFLTFKLENMQIQHNETTQKKAPEHKGIAIVAVVNGEGLKNVFRELGCDVVIDGGKTMNTSAKEFTSVFAELDAEKIVVLPNSPNIIGAAEQAIALSKHNNVTVVPSRSVAQGYFALAMDVADSADTDYRIRQMLSGINDVFTLSQTVASRDYTYMEISCRVGDEILLLNNEMVCVGTNWKDVILNGINKIPDIDEKECCVVFTGKSCSPDQEELLRNSIEECCPWLEVEFVSGGQEIYPWIIGIV